MHHALVLCATNQSRRSVLLFSCDRARARSCHYLFTFLRALQSAIMTAYQNGPVSIHGRRDERYVPSVLCICSVYVIVCDVHAIIDQIRDEGVGDIDETGRTVETAFITASLYERVNFPGRGMCSLCTDPWSYMCGQVVFLHYLFITSARVRRVLEPLGRSGGWAVLATHLRGALPDPPVYHR